MEEENGIETYDIEEKPDYMTGFLFIMAVVLLLFAFGFKNLILGSVGVMCSVLAVLSLMKNMINKNKVK